MGIDENDFTNPAARASVPRSARPRVADDESATHDSFGNAGALIGSAITLAVAGAITWFVFQDWNGAPEVPLDAGLHHVSLGRLVMPAILAAMLLRLIAMPMLGHSRVASTPRTLSMALFIALLAGSAALEASGQLRRIVLDQFGSVPGGPTRMQTFEQGKIQLLSKLPQWSGAPQALDFFTGTWRRQERIYRDDVRRITVRADRGEVFVRVWYECQPGRPPCDAGDAPAAVSTSEGKIMSLAAEVPTPEGRIWLAMASGSAAWQPATIVTQVYFRDAGEWQVSSGLGATLVREKPATALAEFAGDWSSQQAREIGSLTRLTVQQNSTAGMTVRAWSRCEAQRECALGEQTAQIDADTSGAAREVRAVFRRANRELTVILEPPYQGRYEATTENALIESKTGATERGGVVRETGRKTSRERVVLTRGHSADALAVALAKSAAPPPSAGIAASSSPATAPPQVSTCENAQNLHLAARLGCTDKLRALLQTQADELERRSAQGVTALSAAVLANQHQTAEILLKAGANANAPIIFTDAMRPNASGLNRAQRPELNDGSTPLILAQDVAMASLLLRFGADPKAKNSYGWSALFYYAHHGSVDMIDALLRGGADVNDTANVDPSHAGSTPVMWAAYMNRTAQLAALLAYQPRLEIRDRAGKTALDYARGFGHQEAVRLLTAKN